MGRRVRVYDAADIAADMRSTFADRPVEYTHRLQFDWPDELQHVGQSEAVAYGSDKWKHKRGGKRATELYKHLSESDNWAYLVPGSLTDEQTGGPLDTIGPIISLSDMPMPKHFAVLGWCEELHLRLFTGGTDARPRLGRGDEGYMLVRYPRGMVGAGQILWNEVDPYRTELERYDRVVKRFLERGGDPDEVQPAPDFNQTFLFIYTRAGVMALILGDELGIERDGIVG